MQMVEFIRMFEDCRRRVMVSQQPSCLYVSYIFERQLFEDGTNEVIVEHGPRLARTASQRSFGEAAEVHPPKSPDRSRRPRRPCLRDLRRGIHAHPGDGRP